MKRAIYIIILILLFVLDHSFAQKRDIKLMYESVRTIFLGKNYQLAL